MRNEGPRALVIGPCQLKSNFLARASNLARSQIMLEDSGHQIGDIPQLLQLAVVPKQRHPWRSQQHVAHARAVKAHKRLQVMNDKLKKK